MKKFFCLASIFLGFCTVAPGIEKADLVVARIVGTLADDKAVVEDELSHRSRLGPPNEHDPLIARLRQAKEDTEKYLAEIRKIIAETQKEGTQYKAAK